ncbi:TGS domain-containing protein [Candidatus Woesearchaeota archaeon]|nr:TGS domain-containing protein [Candidatus Woesearchaeota archaeon]
MTVNPGIEYQLAEDDFRAASTPAEKLQALQKMWATVPRHKSSEGLQQQIKQKIAKYKELTKKEKSSKKGSRASLSLKKEGSATITLIGAPNSGKSTLLKQLTNANPLIADYPFTTLKPEIGILNYKGIRLQIVEIPAIVENFEKTEKGPTYLSILRMSEMIVLLIEKKDDLRLLKGELEKNDIHNKTLIIKKGDNAEKIKDKIWDSLGLIKVFTKQPGKKADYPPIALKKGATVRDLAEYIHKDFIRKFKYAKVWGNSAKFKAQTFGLDHGLEDNDVVEFHTA